MLYSLRLQDAIAFRASLPASSTAGEAVVVRLRLTNRTERPLDLPLIGQPPVFDIEVSRDDGTAVWQRLAAEEGTPEAWTRTLEPAESLDFEATWNGRDAGGRIAPPGRYRVTGSLRVAADADLATLPVPLHILPAR